MWIHEDSKEQNFLYSGTLQCFIRVMMKDSEWNVAY